MSLTIGRITYANCIPFFHYLRDTGFSGEIVDGVPADLNRRLAAGEIDVCPSSSFEYALHHKDYLLLPGHSISSVGPVYSVLLFAPDDLSALSGQSIALTGESATSVNLLKVVLQEFCGVSDIDCAVPDVEVEALLASGQSALLIGDRALRAGQNVPEGMRIYDLGAIWYHYTGLPFVYALWLVRRDAVARQASAVADFARQLAQARSRAFEALSHIAKQCEGNVPLTGEALVQYWERLSFDLTDGHLEGLRLFFTLCQKYALLPEVPEFEFLRSSP